MPELEHELVALGAALEFPRTPELATTVGERIRRRRVSRVVVAVAFAALALAVAFAVPPARSALLRLLHLGGVTVERVDTLPAGRERGLGQSLGPLVPLHAAERELGFHFLLPPGAHPTHARVTGRLGTVLLEHDGTPLVLSEFRASGYGILKKIVPPSTFMAPVHVGRDPGIWVQGPHHVLYFYDARSPFRSIPIAVRGNVLLWQHAGLALRLQGRLTREQAVEIARSMR